MSWLAAEGEGAVWPMTAAMVLQMVDNGLLDGRLLAMAAKGPEHCSHTRRVANLLRRGYALECVAEQVPVMGRESSLPEPDLAVFLPEFDDASGTLPSGSDCVLVADAAGHRHRAHRREPVCVLTAKLPAMSATLPDTTYSMGAKVRAWSVHVFTLLGLPLAFLAAGALAQGSAKWFFAAMWTTAVIDSVDGTLARKARVKEVVPQFDGALLDNIIDFLTFVFLPVLALPALGLLPDQWLWWAIVPLMASGYQFCQSAAKTTQSFIGFPSYWNVVVIYLYVLDSPPWFTAAVLCVLGLLVFVPTHYLYPSRTVWLRPLTVVLGGVWGIALVAMCVDPDSGWAEQLGWASLYFPLYYFALSFVLDRRIRSGAYDPMQ